MSHLPYHSFGIQRQLLLLVDENRYKKSYQEYPFSAFDECLSLDTHLFCSGRRIPPSISSAMVE